MSARTTEILAKAAGVPLCDVVVIGIKPDASMHLDWSGSTLASLIMHLELAKAQAIDAWRQAEKEYREGIEAA